MAKGDKHWANTWTEIEDLGNGKFGASITVGHRVFFDKADGNKPKKHKLTDERPAKDYILIQGAKCCVEVYPYYTKYFDVQHEEVRLYEERWVVQRWRDPPGNWFDVGAWNPVITVEEYPEPAGDVVKVTVTYDTDYGVLTVEYFQRDGNALKRNVSFKNTSGGSETFRVLQRWAGIVGEKVNGKDYPLITDEGYFAFHNANKPKKQFTIAENLRSMIFNPDGSEKTDQCLQKPIHIESHAQGMKADFIYGNWILAQDESLEIDPATATLDNPTEDSYIGFAASVYTRYTGGDYLYYGGVGAAGLRAFIEWPISSLIGGTLTSNPFFKYHGKDTNASYGEINPITEGQPSITGDSTLYGWIATGTAYVDPFNIVGAASQSQDLGASAKTALQAAMTAEQDWFAIGLQSPGDEGAGNYYSSLYSEEYATANPKPTLYVEYTLPPPVPVADGDLIGIPIIRKS